MVDPSLFRADLERIQYHVRMILSHPKECDYWTGHGCEISMYHDAEDIEKLLSGILAQLDAEPASTA